MTRPPFVDEHHVTIHAPRDRVWSVLRPYAASLGVSPRHPLAKLLGTDPPEGFAITEEEPGRHLGLSGRHRFSDYLLTFDLADADHGRTRLTAGTYAAFPGPQGFVYRTLVIGTRGHVLAVRHMLRTVVRRCGGGGGTGR